jgi:hypothetical protein
MVCAINKIDSNVTGLAIAEEVCYKLLPVFATDGFDPTWYGLEPNEYSDFGGDLSTVARSPIDPSRQNKKGTITDLDASGGWNMDYTKSNFTRIAQGFFFADARQPASTRPLNGAQVTITAATTGPNTYTAASGLGIFAANNVILASGFTNASNNGLKNVSASASGLVTVTQTLVAEAAPPAAAKLERVAYQFASGDINISVTGGIPSLTATVADFTALGDLFIGKWIFLGDDTAANRFANNVGYARIKNIEAKSLTFDDTTFTPVNESGTAKTIRIYVGTSIRNEKTPSLIKRRSYQIERQLGQGPTATQAEYLVGAVANELTINIPQADKLNLDLSFVAADIQYRTGNVGDEIKGGARVPAGGEEAFNTTSDIYRIKLTVLDPTSSNPTALFGYVTEATININNSISPDKAVGVLGAFDVSFGNFEVSGSIDAYFTTIPAVKAVRANSDVSFNIISASKNVGFIFDIPLVGLGGGRVSVQKDAAIKLPLESSGAENSAGYTMQYDNFPYLPNLAMPVVI